MTQSRKMSLVETCANTTLGFLTSYVTWEILSRVFDTGLSVKENLFITCVFTVVSLLRGYLVRRVFNHLGSKR